MIGLAVILAVLAWWLRGRRESARLVRLASAIEAAAEGGGDVALDGEAGKGLGRVGELLAALLAECRDKGEELDDKRQLVGDLAGRLEREERAMRECRVRFEDSRRRDLANAARTLGRTIEGIQAVSGDLGERAGAARADADSQQALVNEAAASMEEMNASIAEVAAAAGHATNDAEAARERAVQGGELVGRTVESIGKANERTSSLAQGLSELGSKAEGIGDIMNVISDIADQTNLLALNAAIEAARAGDAGRGFAVVADEVRKLAEKTMGATRDVASQIEAIQAGVRQSLAEMEQALSLVGEAAEMAGVSGKALGEIVSLAESTSGQVQNMAAATSQQSAASEEINRVIARVHDISVSTAEGMAQAESGVRDLGSRVAELARMNSVFDFIGQGTVQAVIGELAASPDLASMDRDRQERLLVRAIGDNAFLELLYATDAQGRQTVANIPRPGMESAADREAFGRDWSGREWFTAPAASGTLFVSDVYVSSATGEDCITVSAPFFAPSGEMLGVIAADVLLDAA